MNKNRPKVSVLLSVHNHEMYVGQAIESVLRQTYQDRSEEHTSELQSR